MQVYQYSLSRIIQLGEPVEVPLQFIDGYINVIGQKVSALRLTEPPVCEISTHADGGLAYCINVREALHPLMVYQLVSQL
tara:strand:+ start:88 stop:327 length:240 start_codon:yes stop_codon:yes gene_type:complete